MTDPAWMRLEHIAAELSVIGALIEGNGYRLNESGQYTEGREIEISFYLSSCIARIEAGIAEIAEELRQTPNNKIDLPAVASKQPQRRSAQ